MKIRKENKHEIVATQTHYSIGLIKSVYCKHRKRMRQYVIENGTFELISSTNIERDINSVFGSVL